MARSNLNLLGIAFLIGILSAGPLWAESSQTDSNPKNSSPGDDTQRDSSQKDPNVETTQIYRKVKIFSTSEKKPIEKVSGQEAPGELKPISSLDDLKGLNPTQSYYHIHSFILKADSYGPIKPFLTQKTLERTIPNTESRSRVDPAFREEQMFKLVKAILSEKVKITGEKIHGEIAVLKAIPLSKSIMEEEFDSLAQSISDSVAKATESNSSTSETSGNTEGIIVMKLEEGVWKIHRENWRTKLEPSAKTSKATNDLQIWCEESREVPFSQKQASGKLYGNMFTANSAQYSQTVNSLELIGPSGDKWNKPSITLFLFNKGKLPLGQTFRTLRRDSFGAPHVHVRYMNGKKIAKKVFTGTSHYGLKLRFNKALTNGMLTGNIVLRLPESSKSEINGYFHAKVE